MGKGTIGAHIGVGRYTVTLSLDRARSEARIQELTDAINRVDLIELAALEAALEAARADLDQSIQELDAVIGTHDRESMSAAARVVAEKSAARDKARVERDILKLRLAALKKEKSYLQANTPADPVVEAWCADLTEDLSGAVATMEIPGERKGVAVLIRPGDTSAHPNGAAYNPVRDGQLQPSIASKAGGVFYNWALLPGWQKARPAYRIGTIVSIEGDVCALTLDPAQSSAQSLNVNQVESLINVPIVYMDCNGAAFKVDDRVVVEFQTRDWDQPRVIGFESNPRGCGWSGFTCRPSSASQPGGNYTGLALNNGQWTVQENVPGAEMIDWRGPGGLILSYAGPKARHLPDMSFGTEVQSAKSTLYHNGRSYSAGRTVRGAALTASGGVQYLVVVAFEWTGESYFGTWGTRDVLYYAPWEDVKAGTAAWTKGVQYVYKIRDDGVWDRNTPWFFNASGTEAQAIRYKRVSGAEQLCRLKLTLGAGLTGTFSEVGDPRINETTRSTGQANGTILPDGGTPDWFYALETFGTADHAIPLAVDYVGDAERVARLRYRHDYHSLVRYDHSSTDPLRGVWRREIDETLDLIVEMPSNRALTVVDWDWTSRELFIHDPYSATLTDEATNVAGRILYIDPREDAAVTYTIRENRSGGFAGAGTGSCGGNIPVEVFHHVNVTVPASVIRAEHGLSSVSVNFNDSHKAGFASEGVRECRSYGASTVESVLDVFQYNEEQSAAIGIRPDSNWDTTHVKEYNLSRVQTRGYELAEGNGACVPGALMASFRVRDAWAANGRTGGDEYRILNFLTGQDPVALTGVAGANPRFDPIGVR